MIYWNYFAKQFLYEVEAKYLHAHPRLDNKSLSHKLKMALPSCMGLP